MESPHGYTAGGSAKEETGGSWQAGKSPSFWLTPG